MEWTDQIYDCKARANGILFSNDAVCMEVVIATHIDQLKKQRRKFYH